MSMTFPPMAPFTVDRRQQIFLGVDVETGKRAWSDGEASVGVVGPPRSGKTSGLLIAALMYWDGAAVVASTRGDILRAVGDRRRALADPSGGGVYIYDPTGSEPGVTSLHWSALAGCEDAEWTYRQVHAMTGSAGRGISDGDHWTGGAADILRPYFHAAAIAKKGMRDVRTWLSRQELDEPADILVDHGSEAAFWGEDLRSLRLIGERERGSYFSVARRAIAATSSPKVLAFSDRSDLDVDRFLATGSTLFIVGPSRHQAALSPMIVGLVNSIAERASEIAARHGGRLRRPLLLALDEVANTAPMDLGPLVSEGGGRGILTLWTAQNLAQLRARYGDHGAEAILSASTVKVTYGGLVGDSDVFSSWAGEAREASTTYHGASSGAVRAGSDPTGAAAERAQMSREHSVSTIYRPLLPSSEIRRTPPGYAYLWYRSEPHRLVMTPPALMLEPYRALAGYTPD